MSEQLSTLGSLSRYLAQRERAGYRKEILTCFAYLVSLKSHGGEPERLGILCFDFPFLFFFLSMSS